jgi:lipopolysaccharide/colanic/teichoic acid biosynthesis glycosyltransferase
MASVTTSVDRAPASTPAPGQGDPDCLLEVPPGWYPALKGAADVAAALVLLVLSAPVMLLSGLLVKLTSRGPVLYTQTRLGRDGRPYTIYKIRTMTHNCESATGACWSTTGDPRITPVGRFLRDTHLDELPQLWNVLRGDMSLVGPRPERPEFVPRLEQAIPRYRQRLLVRPGVTGLAQIQLPADTDVASVRRKLAYDLHYVQVVSFWLDVRIVFGTGLKVLGVRSGMIRKVCWLPSPEEPDQTDRGPSPTAATGVVLRPLPA